MAVELTPLGKVVVGVVKWVAIPLVIAWICMAFVGPMIGGPTKEDNFVKAESTNKPRVSENERKFLEVREKGH